MHCPTKLHFFPCFSSLCTSSKIIWTLFRQRRLERFCCHICVFVPLFDFSHFCLDLYFNFLISSIFITGFLDLYSLHCFNFRLWNFKRVFKNSYSSYSKDNFDFIIWNASMGKGFRAFPLFLRGSEIIIIFVKIFSKLNTKYNTYYTMS